ncbi:hypothetical protein ACFJ57_003098 [Salmonella enterica]|uniref:hypothetical protein n=1 Tax=Salmonella enterica TaxID=28901 RepID=UPI001E316CDC|nr:hypothetical protein [Salmonella enterica]
MARIRTIKPEFWTDEDLSEVSEPACLLALGLLNYADDEGYFNANPKLIKASVFPLREPSVPITVQLRELSDCGYISLFSTSDGKNFGVINNFQKHQVINKPKESKIKELDLIPYEYGSGTVSIPPGMDQGMDQGKDQGKDQNLLRGAEKISPPPPEENLESCGLNLHDGTRPAHAGPERRPLSAGVPEMPRPDDPEFIRLPLNDGSEFSVTESLVSEFVALYPAVDVRQALRNQRGWLLSDQRRRKTARGIKKFITCWLAKDQNRGGNRGRDSPPRIQDLPPPDNVIPPGFRG